jgi:hypothetical protein
MRVKLRTLQDGEAGRRVETPSGRLEWADVEGTRTVERRDRPEGKKEGRKETYFECGTCLDDGLERVFETIDSPGARTTDAREASS